MQPYRLAYKNGATYLDRFRVIDTPFFSIFIHAIRGTDPDPDLHDHPRDFLSFLVWGRYVEEIGDGWKRCAVPVGWFNFKRARVAHRIVQLSCRTVWTIVIGGARRREWGFQTRNGWVHWKQYKEEHGSGVNEA